MQHVLTAIQGAAVVGDDVGALLRGTLAERSDPWRLASAALNGGDLSLRDTGAPVGQRVHVKVLARDIRLVTSEPRHTSIENHFPCIVDSIAPDVCGLAYRSAGEVPSYFSAMRKRALVCGRRSWCVWLAMLAIAAQALLPLVHASIARAAPAGERIPVCTALGLVWIDAGDSAPGGGDARDHRHCPLCATSTPLLAGSAARIAPPVPSSVSVCRALGAPPRTASTEAVPPPPRGPPELS